MATERPKGISIVSGRQIIHDDQTPTIDPYGLSMVESLCGGLQRLLYDMDDPAVKQRLEQLTGYAEDLVDRYS